MAREPHDTGCEFGRIETARLELERARLDFGKVDHVVDEAAQELARFLDGGGDLELRIVDRFVCEVHRHVAQSVERRADLMADDVEEFLFCLHCRLGTRFGDFRIAAPLFACGMGTVHALEEVGILEAQAESFVVAPVDASRPAGDGREEHGRQQHDRDGKRLRPQQQDDGEGKAGGERIIDNGGWIIRARNRGSHHQCHQHQHVENLVREGRARHPEQRADAPCRAAHQRDERIAVRPFHRIGNRLGIGAKTGAHTVEGELGDKLDRGDGGDRPDGRGFVEGETHNDDGTEHGPAARFAKREQELHMFGVDSRFDGPLAPHGTERGHGGAPGWCRGVLKICRVRLCHCLMLRA